jgi:hypothetical protein
MTPFRAVLSITFCFLIAGPMLAQTEEIQRQVDEKLLQLRLYEDVEIMRRLLNRSLLDAYGFTATMRGDNIWSIDVGVPDDPRGAALRHRALLLDLIHPVHQPGLPSSDRVPAHHFSEAEGTYLKGHGVIYSMTLPVPMHDPRPESAAPAAKPLSDWERLRRELRGEKVEAGGSPRTPSDPRVADVVLKLLAQNGRHFAHLPENEQLTVAVTFRGQSCVACHGTLGGRAGGGMSPFGPGGAGAGGTIGGLGSPDFPGTPAPGSAGIPGTAAPPGGPAAIGGSADSTAKQKDSTNPVLLQLRAQVDDHVLLGDLHSKQGRYRDALDAYEKAVEVHAEALKKAPYFSNVSSQYWLRLHMTSAELHSKLTQGYVALGEKEKALSAFQRFAEATAEVGRLSDPTKRAAGTSKQKNAASRSMPLPSKLIISAPKKLLDLVAKGTMSFDEFKKQATVEYLPFASAEGSGSADGGPAKP